MMGALEKKLFRDLWLLRAQVSAIVVVVAAGVAIFFAMMGAYDALVRTQSDYYRQYRLGDVFARVVRAPLSAARAAEGIAGVAEVRARVAIDVAADVPGLGEPAMLHIVSMPAAGALDGVFLRSGAPPERPDEIVLNEAFALADHLGPGSTVTATLAGRRHLLRVVGVGLSPEFVFQGGATLIPDDHRFGVGWMEEKALAASAGMAGAFNDLSLSLAPGTGQADVLASLDSLLAPWGAFGAQGRRDGLFSDRILSDKITQLRASAQLVPTVFLGVAAFLLNVVLGRLVATQRTQIGTLKAFGLSDFRVGLHYLELVLVVVLVGTVVGAVGGAWLGSGLIALYRGYYHFPDLTFRPEPATLFTAAGIALLASSLGAMGAVRRATALPPAEAMRPEPPPVFRAGVLDRPGVRRVLGTSARMALRNLLRRPGRTALSVLGVAFAAAIMVLVGAMSDALGYLCDVYFNESQRSDATVLFADARPVPAARELASMPGVLRAEPFRAVAVTLHHGPLRYRTAITGVARDGELHPIVDAGGHEVAIPEEGLVLSRILAEKLAVGTGDALEVELLEGRHRTRPAQVVAVVDDLMGVAATMDLDALTRLAEGSPLASGVELRTDERRIPAVLAGLRATAEVASVSLRTVAQKSFTDQIDQSLGVTQRIEVVFAFIIAFAVVYNSARTALSERSRELATLRVLGFSNVEVAGVLLGELAAITAAAIPVGLALGYVIAAATVRAAATDLMRIPFIIHGSTFSGAAIVVALSALVSAVIVGRQVTELDLVSVLKTRD